MLYISIFSNKFDLNQAIRVSHIKFFTAVINSISKQARKFAIVSHFNPSLVVDEPAWVEPIMGLHNKGHLLSLPINIRLGCKWITVTNTLAYYDTDLITAVKFLQN